MPEYKWDERTNAALEKRQNIIVVRDFQIGVGTELENPKYKEAVRSPNFVLSWILTGSGRYTEGGEVYPLQDGCVCLRRPGRAYNMQLQKKGGIRLFLTIPADMYPAIVRMIPEVDDITPVYWQPYDKALCDRFCALYDRFSQVTFRDLYELLPDMIHYILQLTDIEKARDNRPLDMAKRMLDENLTLSLQEIAERCGLTYTTFRHRMTEILGEPPGQYRIKRRVERACALLKNGYSVNSTAAKLGYVDAFTFSHQFTAVMGIAPGKYQKENWQETK